MNASFSCRHNQFTFFFLFNSRKKGCTNAYYFTFRVGGKKNDFNISKPLNLEVSFANKN